MIVVDQSMRLIYGREEISKILKSEAESHRKVFIETRMENGDTRKGYVRISNISTWGLPFEDEMRQWRVYTGLDPVEKK